MKTSAAGIALICGFETCRLETYPDPVGIPTIGWGHTGPDVGAGLSIDQARADELLKADLAVAEQAVERAVHVPLTQGQFDALVSFAYNVKGWRDSTLIRKLNAGDYAGAALEFPRWCHAGDKVLSGLVKRRAAEQAMFNGETA